MEKVYLAASYGRRLEMLDYANYLKSCSCEVTSRWLYGTHEKATGDYILDMQRFASEDLVDIANADTVIVFAGVSPRGRGGRHVETGYAIALGKQIIIIGERENVFHYLAGTEHYATWEDFVDLEEIVLRIEN